MEVGNIVTVVNPDLKLFKEQGVVAKIVSTAEFPIVVEFAPHHRHQCGLHREASGQLDYQPEDLRVDTDFTAEEKANRTFGPYGWHSIYALEKPFDSQAACSLEGCVNTVAARGVVNCQGSVCEVDTCVEHYNELNGSRRDALPPLKKAQPVSPSA